VGKIKTTYWTMNVFVMMSLGILMTSVPYYAQAEGSMDASAGPDVPALPETPLEIPPSLSPAPTLPPEASGGPGSVTQTEHRSEETPVRPALTSAATLTAADWRNRWRWTAMGSGGALVLAWMQKNAVSSANAEQQTHIQAIKNNPMMNQSEYNAHASAIRFAESQAKQAKTLSDLFFLASAGLFGTASYIYLHPPQGVAVARRGIVVPVFSDHGVAVRLYGNW